MTQALVAAKPPLPAPSEAALVTDQHRRRRRLVAANDLEVRYPGTDPQARTRRFAIDRLELVPGALAGAGRRERLGKTTALRALLGLVTADAGAVTWDGRSVTDLRRGRAARTSGPSVQPIPQDVDGALDPRQTHRLGHRRGLARRWPARTSVPGEDQAAVVARLLDEVGLPASAVRRHPHEVSGGQRQRAIIARALAVGPRILLLDEPTSGLDATVAVRILELIERLRVERGLGILLISHDLGVVSRLCPETVVLYRGEVVERGATERLLVRPRHPYTAALRRSVPEFGVPFRVPFQPAARRGHRRPRDRLPLRTAVCLR